MTQAATKDVFLNVRVDRATHRKLSARARSNERTLAGEIRAAIKRHLEQQ